MDLFNGKIKVLKNGLVRNFKYNGDYKLPSDCEIFNNKIYFIDSTTNKLFFQKLKESNILKEIIDIASKVLILLTILIVPLSYFFKIKEK